MTAAQISAVMLFAGAVCFLIGAATNLWITLRGTIC